MTEVDLCNFRPTWAWCLGRAVEIVLDIERGNWIDCLGVPIKNWPRHVLSSSPSAAFCGIDKENAVEFGERT